MREVARRPGAWDTPWVVEGIFGRRSVGQKTLSRKHTPGLSGNPHQGHRHRWSRVSFSSGEPPSLPLPKDAERSPPTSWSAASLLKG